MQSRASTIAALAASALLLVSGVAPAQQTARTHSFKAGPAYLQAEGGPSSVGLRWDARLARSGGLDSSVRKFPRTWHVEGESRGAAALDPDANLEPLRAAAELSYFVVLYAPSIDTSPNPDAPTKGGFDFGAVYMALRGDVEADQRFDEVAATIGGQLRYTIERQDGLWPLLPSFDASFLLVKPTASALRDSLNLETKSHRRGEIDVFWHVPLFRTPLRAHADLRFWGTDGLDPELKDLDRDAGMRTALGLGWVNPTTLGRIRIDEVFGRWTGGKQPVVERDTKTWMIGVVANLAGPSSR